MKIIGSMFVVVFLVFCFISCVDDSELTPAAWMCDWERGYERGPWTASSNTVSDGAAAEIECEKQIGPGGNCFACSREYESASEPMICTCSGECIVGSGTRFYKTWSGQAWNKRTARGECANLLDKHCDSVGLVAATRIIYGLECYD